MTNSSCQNFKTNSQSCALNPKTIQTTLNVTSGDELVGRLEGGRLVLESRRSLLERLQARYAEVEGSLADELLAERREEAVRE